MNHVPLPRRRRRLPPAVSPRRILLFIALAAMAFLLSACTPPIKAYVVDVRYLFAGPPDEEDGQERVAINVARFRDGRAAMNERTVGAVNAPWWRDSVPILLKEKTTAEIVADGVRAQLFRSGFIITGPPPRWNLEAGSLDRAWGRYVLGGVIEELVRDGKNDPPFCDYDASVKLTFVLGDTQTGQTERFSVERESFFLWVTMSEDSLERQINSLLSQVIADGLHEDRVRRALGEVSGKPRVR